MPLSTIVRQRLNDSRASAVIEGETAVTARELTLSGEIEEPVGSEEAAWLDQLIRAHERQVLMTAYRMLGRMEDAQDAAQEVFLRLHRHRRKLDANRNPAPWLYRVTMNVCFDLRRRTRELPLSDSLDVADSRPGADAALELESRRRQLHEALQQLPDKQRAAIVLRDVEGLSTREVAGVLGSSEVTVRSQISTGRLRLRALIGRRK